MKDIKISVPLFGAAVGAQRAQVEKKARVRMKRIVKLTVTVARVKLKQVG